MWQDEAHLPLLEQKLVKDKMAKFHQDVSSIKYPTCLAWRSFLVLNAFFFTCIYICMSVGLSTTVYGKPIQKNGMPKCMGGITWSKHAHAQIL